jgi:hypothetical protein
VLQLYTIVDVVAGGRQVPFWHEWPRKLLTCLSGGFSGRFCAATKRGRMRCTGTRGQHVPPLLHFFGFALNFSFCRLGFWVSHMGFGYMYVFFGRVVRGFWWVLGVCWVGVLSGQV